MDKDNFVESLREFTETVLPLMIEKQIEQKIMIKPATMSIKEAAVYLGVHPDTVKKLIREKQLPHVRIAGRILLRACTLDRYMDLQEIKSVE